MTCPDCGYMMTAFDKDCPRCEKLQQAQRSCLKCGTAYAQSAQECPRCHHGNGQPLPDVRFKAAPEHSAPATPPLILGVPFAQTMQSGNSQTPQTPGEGGHPASVLPPDYLACRVCGNGGVQKISAICQAGTWSGQSQGQTFGMAYGPNGPVPVTGQTTAATSGATTLAQMLMPPQRPAYSENGCAPAIGAVTGTFGLAFAVLALIMGGTDAVGAVIIWLIIFGGGVAIYTKSSSAGWDQKKRVLEQMPHWEKAMVVWNRLFYCPRCAHVFDPASGSFGTVHQMSELIRPKAVALDVASNP